MATCSVARISLIQGMRDFGSRSLAFVKIRATEQVAIKKRKAKISLRFSAALGNSSKLDCTLWHENSCRFVRFVGKKNKLVEKKNK